MDDRVLSTFVGDDGRLRMVPTKQTKLVVVLDHLAQRFEPGRRYSEAEVNDAIMEFHPDYALFRRHLVDHGFMTREDGLYWRSGGTFDV